MNNKKNVKLNRFTFKKVLRYITNRFWIKVLCLLMSFLLFLFVRYQKEYTKDYITKVEIRNIPQKLLIANNIPENITITLKGFKDNIYEIPTEFTAYIDLSNAQIGSNMYDINLDGNIDYSKMNITLSPNKIPIILDELSYKTVPIHAATVGEAPFGLRVDDIIVNPSNTIISGPKTLLSAIDEINTYNVDLTDRYLDFSTMSRINLPSNIKSDVLKAAVRVIFNKDVDRLEFTNISVNIDNLNSKFNLNSDIPIIVNKLVLEVNRGLVNNISINDIFIYMDLIDMTNSGIYSNVSIEANIPLHTKLVEVEPSFFNIELIERLVYTNEQQFSNNR